MVAFVIAWGMGSNGGRIRDSDKTINSAQCLSAFAYDGRELSGRKHDHMIRFLVSLAAPAAVTEQGRRAHKGTPVVDRIVYSGVDLDRAPASCLIFSRGFYTPYYFFSSLLKSLSAPSVVHFPPPRACI